MSKCINPQQIRNKTTGKLHIVRCRKCSNCQREAKLKDIERITDEAKYYKYSIMLTLTYNNFMIPTKDLYHSKIVFTDNKVYRVRNNLSRQEINDIKNYIINYETIKNNIKYINYFVKSIANEEIKDLIKKVFKREYDEYFIKERGQKLYYALINKYATLSFKDLKDYIDKIKDNNDKNYKIDFKYFFAGEYPNLKYNRARPHYHGLILTNNLKILDLLLRKWYYGNIAIGRGDKELDLKPNEQKQEYRRFFRAKNILTGQYEYRDGLNMIVRPITIEGNTENEEDIERIKYYIENEHTNLKNKNDNQNDKIAKYIASYVSKKRDAENEEKHNYNKLHFIKIKNYKDLSKKQRAKIFRFIKKYETKAKNENIKLTWKQEPFIYKSQKLGYRFVEKNIKELIKNKFKRAYYDKNNNYKLRRVNNAYINYAKKIYNSEYIKRIINQDTADFKLEDIKKFTKENKLNLIEINENVRLNKDINKYQADYDKALEYINSYSSVDEQIENISKIKAIRDIDKELKQKGLNYNSITVLLGKLHKKIKDFVDFETFIKSELNIIEIEAKKSISNFVWKDKTIKRKDKNNKIKELYSKIKNDILKAKENKIKNNIYVVNNYDKSVDFVYCSIESELLNIELKKQVIILNYKEDKKRKELFGETEYRDFEKSIENQSVQNEYELTIDFKELTEKDFKKLKKKNDLIDLKKYVNNYLCLSKIDFNNNYCESLKNNVCCFKNEICDYAEVLNKNNVEYWESDREYGKIEKAKLFVDDITFKDFNKLCNNLMGKVSHNIDYDIKPEYLKNRTISTLGLEGSIKDEPKKEYKGDKEYWNNYKEITEQEKKDLLSRKDIQKYINTET